MLITNKDLINRFNEDFKTVIQAELQNSDTIRDFSTQFIDFMKKVNIFGGRIHETLYLHAPQRYTLYATYEKRNWLIVATLGESASIESDEGDVVILETIEETRFLEETLRKSGVKQFIVDFTAVLKQEKPDSTLIGQTNWEVDDKR